MSSNILTENSLKGSLYRFLFSAFIFAVLVALIWIISSLLNLHQINHSPIHNVIFFNVQIILASSSALLTIILLSNYLQNFLRYRTNFTLGFIILALVLLAHSITSNPIFFSYFGYQPMQGPFSIIAPAFTTIAVLALLYLDFQ